MKRLMFHAIQPQPHEPQGDWENFLREASFLQLPQDTEQLAPNVWLLPDDRLSYLELSKVGQRNAMRLGFYHFCPRQAGSLSRLFRERATTQMFLFRVASADIGEKS